jgi:hypothetical protein
MPARGRSGGSLCWHMYTALRHCLDRLLHGSEPGLSRKTREYLDSISSRPRAPWLPPPQTSLNSCIFSSAATSPSCTLVLSSTPRNLGARVCGPLPSTRSAFVSQASAPSVDAGLLLTPLQLGVGVPGRNQFANHALQSGLSCCPADVILHLDIQTTFNSVSRQTLLQVMSTRTP